MMKILKHYFSVVSIIVALNVSLCFMAAPAYAELPAYKFNIQPQLLIKALKAFSEVTAFQFVYTQPEIAEIKTKGLVDHLTSDASLQKLLEGTNVKYEYVNDNTVRLYLIATKAPDNENLNRNPESRQNKSLVNVLEEITVTSRKREESLRDVPISVSVFTGKKLRNNAIVNLEMLTDITPNVFVVESFVGDALFVRGVGSSQNNMGIEQAVGQVIDGVFYGRSRFTRLSYLDIERVEVLKGPQGALIGKNTTAGAINLTTAKPTDEFEAWITPTYELLASKGVSLEGAVSGPLSEKVKVRLAVRYDDHDGYLENTETSASHVADEDLFGRVHLLWQPSDNLDATTTYQYSRMERVGENSQFSNCDLTSVQVSPDTNLTSMLTTGSTEDCTANYKRTGAAPRNNQGDFSGKVTNFDTFALVVNWQTGLGTLTSITGWAEYDFREIMDSDRTVEEVLAVEFTEDYEQWSQEIRLLSPTDKRFEYIAGLYALGKKQSTTHNVDFRDFNARRNALTEEDGLAYSAFAEFTWHFNEQWAATLAGRYTYEEKDGHSRGFPSDIYTSNPTTVPSDAPASLATKHDVSQKLDEANFSPSLILEWRPTEEIMIYGSARRGFKAGAFNHALVGNQADAEPVFAADKEEVIAFELGSKITLLGSRAQINLALFRSEFDDLQQAVLNPTTIINDLINAAESTSQGFEFEGRWRSTDNLTLFAGFAYLDSTFDDFPNATCYALQSSTECINGRQNLSGKPFQFATDWSATLEAEYLRNVTSGFQIRTLLRAYYSGEFFLQQDLDPRLIQDSFWKFDAILSVSSPDDRWSISLIGRNLGDKTTANYGDDVPLQPGSVWQAVAPPRSFAVQGEFRF